MHTPDFTTFYLPYLRSHRQAWVRGELRDVWFNRYKGVLFDDDDLRLSRNQPKNHYFEWRCAMAVHAVTGMHCLLEKYELKTHKRKYEEYSRRIPPPLLSYLTTWPKPDFGSTGCPDLFFFRPDSDQWFYCEVKEEKEDFHGLQVAYFKHLEGLTSRNIFVARFIPLD